MVSRHPQPWFNLELYPAVEELFYYPPPSGSGRDYQLEVGGHQCSVGSLLEELYQKTGTFQLWSLVRHMAGVLEKTVEDLGTVREEMPSGAAASACLLCSPLTSMLTLSPPLYAGSHRSAGASEELLCWAAKQRGLHHSVSDPHSESRTCLSCH